MASSTSATAKSSDGQQHLLKPVASTSAPHTAGEMEDAFGNTYGPIDDIYFAPDLINQVFSTAIFKKPASWRHKIYHFMHSPLCQTIIVVFVILDCLVVFAQLYVDLQNEKEKYALLEAECVHNDTEMAKEKEHQVEAYEIALEALHYTSMVLISMFFVEVVVKMVTGWHHFITSILEVLDACIVIISFGLDVMLMFEEVNVVVESIAQLLILLRLWRIARIVNGAAVAMDSKWQTKYHALEDKYKLLEARLAEIEGPSQPSQKIADDKTEDHLDHLDHPKD